MPTATQRRRVLLLIQPQMRTMFYTFHSDTRVLEHEWFLEMTDDLLSFVTCHQDCLSGGWWLCQRCLRDREASGLLSLDFGTLTNRLEGAKLKSKSPGGTGDEETDTSVSYGDDASHEMRKPMQGQSDVLPAQWLAQSSKHAVSGGQKLWKTKT